MLFVFSINSGTWPGALDDRFTLQYIYNGDARIYGIVHHCTGQCIDDEVVHPGMLRGFERLVTCHGLEENWSGVEETSSLMHSTSGRLTRPVSMRVHTSPPPPVVTLEPRKLFLWSRCWVEKEEYLGKAGKVTIRAKRRIVTVQRQP